MKSVEKVLKKLLLLVPLLKLIFVKGFKKRCTTSLKLAPPPPLPRPRKQECPKRPFLFLSFSSIYVQVMTLTFLADEWR
jgi:hypothetical protein